MSLNYRDGVVGVFVNKKGEVLVGERSDAPGQWQFPQGGCLKGEKDSDAIRREISEEVGVDDFKIKLRSSDTTEYLFPNKLSYPEDKTPFDGQSHRWFLLEFNDQPDNYLPDCSKIDDEFLRFKWVLVQTAYDNIVEWKKDSYKKGLGLLGFNIKTKDSK